MNSIQPKNILGTIKLDIKWNSFPTPPDNLILCIGFHTPLDNKSIHLPNLDDTDTFNIKGCIVTPGIEN